MPAQVVLDAKDMRQLAVAHLGEHLPYGLHGNFTPTYYGPDGRAKDC